MSKCQCASSIVGHTAHPQAIIQPPICLTDVVQYALGHELFFTISSFHHFRVSWRIVKGNAATYHTDLLSTLPTEI